MKFVYLKNRSGRKMAIIATVARRFLPASVAACSIHCTPQNAMAIRK